MGRGGAAAEREHFGKCRLRIRCSSEFYRGPINGIQLISTNACLQLHSSGNKLAAGQPTRSAGPIRNISSCHQWTLAIGSGIATAFLGLERLAKLHHRPFGRFRRSTNKYYVVVSNNVNSATSSVVHLALVPPLLRAESSMIRLIIYRPIAEPGRFIHLRTLPWSIQTVYPTPMPMASPWR